MRALICGATGQDGAYLARLLSERGYEVHGTSRHPDAAGCFRLDALGVREHVHMHTMAPASRESVLRAVAKIRPDEIYYLAGQSSVAMSFQQPGDTIASIAGGTLNVLEAVLALELPARLFFAGSGDCFGDTPMPASETSPMRPRSPYGAAKSLALGHVQHYRQHYGLHACTGILFSHESPLRDERFVTQKIVRAACRIAEGSPEPLVLGNLDVARDWGWASEYVEAMWRVLQQDEARDYVIATGATFPLRAFVARAFASVGLDWSAHVVSDPSLFRPSEILVSRADPTRARSVLGWTACLRMPEVVDAMVEFRRRDQGGRPAGD
jgi:GDPmannose 4,6-dehydratase